MRRTALSASASYQAYTTNDLDFRSGGEFIASLTEGPDLRYIKLSANRDGSFAMTNSRTGYTKHYPARARP